jgi:hypothetical protein
MAFQVSPGINVSEIDLTTIVPAVSTTEGAIAGCFRWGPCETVQLIDNESKLAARFGKPTNYNPETWFTAANFLAYGNALYVSRAFDSTNMLNAYANSGTVTSNSAMIVKNDDAYVTAAASFDADVEFVAKYPGALGNSLKISVCDTAAAYASTIDLTAVNSNTLFANSKLTLAVGATSATVILGNTAALAASTPLPHATVVAGLYTVGDYIRVGNTSIGYQDLKITNVGSVQVVNTAGTNSGFAQIALTLEDRYRLSTAWESSTVDRKWEYSTVTDAAPGQSQFMTATGSAVADELHVVVSDEDGLFTGQKGAVLEVFKGLSRATDAKTADGSTNYYATVLNNLSQYVWYASDRTGAATAAAASLAAATTTTPYTTSFVAGADGGDEGTIAFADIARAYDAFASPETVDISLVMTGKSRGSSNGAQLANYLIDNIAEARKDCVVFISPEYADVVNNTGLDQAADTVTFRNSVTSSSYAVLDSGYKYQYDKYNDLYRWIPLNGDVAGLAVRTDATNDPWYSPAGFNRGIIKNVIKLAYNPSQADRDLLYKNGINPVVTFPGQGTVLYGDKTLLSVPSAFDRINVRRLFIALEKAISRAAKATLFEFNDEFTRARFVGLVEPFLRDVQGRRGVTDFRVVCNETNNTAEVVDSNRFVGDIYIKPARAINFIQLNFVAVRTGVEFSEVVGKF